MPRSKPKLETQSQAQQDEKGSFIETRLTSAKPEFHLRGHSIYDLTEDRDSLDALALLCYGDLPNADLRADLQCRFAEIPDIDPALKTRIAELPWHLSLQEVLRQGLLESAQFDERTDDRSVEGIIERALSLTWHMTQVIAQRYCATQGLPVPHLENVHSLPELILTLLRGEVPETLETHAVDQLLVLFSIEPESPADLAVRASASRDADLTSALLAGLCACESLQIGRQSEETFNFLDQIESEDDLDAACSRIAQGEMSLPGFAEHHSEVTLSREEILTGVCSQLAKDRGQEGFEELAERLEQASHPAMPGVSWPLARLCYYLGLEHELIAPLLSLARISGWTAHYLEQLGSSLSVPWRYAGNPLRNDNTPER